MPLIIKSKEDIQESIKILADQINQDYIKADVIDIVCFVNGASIFCSDLVRLVKKPINLHHFAFSSYKDMPLSGAVEIKNDISDSLENKHILILEGLIISGKTPLYLCKFFKLRNPLSLKICALGVKNESIEANLKVDYCMFNFKDEWVEGYGIGGPDSKCLPHLVDVRED